MDETRKCPYCAEDVREEATRCPHCRSHLPASEGMPWCRDHPDRRLAGVATSVARTFGISVAAARIGFIALTFVHLLGPLTYAALWLAIPFRPDEPSWLERGLGQVRDAVGRMRSRSTVPGGPFA
jgi:phage shock protein PspC (stress-responsive transcriptional regulator)